MFIQLNNHYNVQQNYHTLGPSGYCLSAYAPLLPPNPKGRQQYVYPFTHTLKELLLTTILDPYTKGDADPLLNYPYGCCGKEVPGLCKGHLDLLDTEEGKPTANWAAGQKANFSLSGHAINTPTYNPQGGTHSGGSCQVGFSVDKGKTFKVVKTWQGNCPYHDSAPTGEPGEQIYDFTVPADLPAGNAVFAWTWVNREKEFNMNCASVTISGNNGEAPEQPKESQLPTPSQPSYSEPTSAPSQYTVQGCTCECPSQSWTEGCKCHDCESPSKNRREVEREVVALHRRRLQQAEKLKAPVRRAETVAFKNLPDMQTFDFENAECESPGGSAELKFPNPGPQVEETPGNNGYELVEGTCK